MMNLANECVSFSCELSEDQREKFKDIVKEFQRAKRNDVCLMGCLLIANYQPEKIVNPGTLREVSLDD